MLAVASPTFPALCTCTRMGPEHQHATLHTQAVVPCHHPSWWHQYPICICKEKCHIWIRSISQRIMLIIRDKTPLLKMKMACAAPPGQNHPDPLTVGIYWWQLTLESSCLQTPYPWLWWHHSCFPPASLTSSLPFFCIFDKLVIAWIPAPTLFCNSSVALDFIPSRGCSPHQWTEDASVQTHPSPQLQPHGGSRLCSTLWSTPQYLRPFTSTPVAILHSHHPSSQIMHKTRNDSRPCCILHLPQILERWSLVPLPLNSLPFILPLILL